MVAHSVSRVTCLALYLAEPGYSGMPPSAMAGMKPTAKTFEQWNEERAIKHDLDKFYNHPNPLVRYIENKRIRTLIDLASIKDTDAVLEVGCGAGHILERIDRGTLYGIDISEVQIQRAQERVGHRAELKKSAGEALPYGDKSFDKILCSEVIEHVLDPISLLKEMQRVLKDDGILSMSIPNEGAINCAKKALRATGLMSIVMPARSGWDLGTKNNLDEWHLHAYSLALIRQHLADTFAIRTVRRIPLFFVPFRYVLALKKYSP
jgi:ubiquinone/menaquinone biosynthesis C-methylase UbiE